MTEESPISRVIGAIVPRAVDAVPVELIIDKVDVDELIKRVDVDDIIQRVDIDALLTRIDLDALLARIDMDALLTRVDLNGVIGQLDMDSLLDSVDIKAIVDKAGIDQIVAEATTGVAARTLDLFRRQIVGLDMIVTSVVDRITHRAREVPEEGFTPQGRPAGPISRTLAFLIDAAIVAVMFSLGVGLGQKLIGLFTGGDVKPTRGSGGWWAVAYFLWWGFYLWIGFEVAGCTPGKALLGMRVRDKDGGPMKGGRALVRVIVYPFSFILALGLIPGLLRKDRRALHDLAAGSQEVIDWGERSAELPSALSRWVAKRQAEVIEASLAPEPVAAAPEPAAVGDAGGEGGDGVGNASEAPEAGATPPA